MPNSVTGEYRDTTSVDAGPPPSLQGKASREQGLLLLSNRRGPSNTEGLFPQHPAVQQVVSKSSVAPTGFPTHRPVRVSLQVMFFYTRSNLWLKVLRRVFLRYQFFCIEQSL